MLFFVKRKRQSRLAAPRESWRMSRHNNYDIIMAGQNQQKNKTLKTYVADRVVVSIGAAAIYLDKPRWSGSLWRGRGLGEAWAAALLLERRCAR
jgi:hypothetical protein